MTRNSTENQKFLNTKNALERDDTQRATEFASPAFLEAVLKACYLTERGAATFKGKIMTEG